MLESGLSCCTDWILNCVQEISKCLSGAVGPEELAFSKEGERCGEKISRGQIISSKTPCKNINLGKKAEFVGRERESAGYLKNSSISVPFTNEAERKL